MLRELAQEESVQGKTLTLDVLSDNAGAIELYKQSGFVITDSREGFNRDGEPKPKCYTMKKLQQLS